MAPRLRFLCAKGWTEAVHLAERRGGGLVIELSVLRQVRLVLEIFHFEKSGCAFARGGREYGRIAQREAVVIEKVAHRFDDLVTDFQNGALPRRSNPEMALIHEELDAVFLGRDRERLLFRHDLVDPKICDVKLKPARRTGFSPDLSRNFDR